jgi:cobyrinic acid a,c-diamide synthase
VVLVVNSAKVTRTVAAVVLGCQRLDPDLEIAGVVLNRVAGTRHETLIRRAVETICGVDVVGVIPRLETDLLPSRHLGLVPPEARQGLAELEARLLSVARDHLALDRLLAIAAHAPALAVEPRPDEQPTSDKACGFKGEPGDGSQTDRRSRARIGVFSDSAFTFYYPDNLEALEAAGAELVWISALRDTTLPQVDALYLGGGFPESHAVRLAENRSLHHELRQVADAGMPIYAECGGMIYLARSLTVEGKTHAMAGVLPIDLELFKRPQGHGYVELRVDQPNPFFDLETTLRGHEFHYTRIVGDSPPPLSVFEVKRGTGCGGGRDGLLKGNVLAAYTHLHAGGTPQWAVGLVNRARQW